MILKLHSLQALRAIAASLVVADHALLEITKNQPENPVTHLGWALGNTGVSVFFVVSGFIMVHICWENFGGWAAATNFLGRRVIRIVPLYWLATVAALAFHRISATHGAHDGWTELLYSLSFIPYSSVEGSWGPVLPQGWTLSYEMMFYAIFALGLSFPRQIGLPAVGAILGMYIILGPHLPNASLAYLASPIVLWFVLGIGLAAFWHWRGFEEPSWLARLTSVLEGLGDASYSTYLVHGLILTVLLRIWTMTAGPPTMWILPVSLVVATAAGWVTHVLVEKPILRIIARMRQPERRTTSFRLLPATPPDPAPPRNAPTSSHTRAN
jgi:exopolysaccharide production protein ExoZ